MPGNQSRDVKIIRETSNYQSEPNSHSSSYQTHERVEEHGLNRMALPEHLAPGPNTKVTKTVKTYTYELPGTPETYRRQQQQQQLTTNVNENSIYKIDRSHQEDFHSKPVVSPYPSSPTNYETTTTKKENFYIRDERYENGYIPVDRVDYPGFKNQPPLTETTTTTVIDRVEEFIPDNKTIVNGKQSYYTSAPPQTNPNHQGLSSSVYKYSKETHSDREVLLPKPFPTGTQLYPVNGHTPNNGQGPPKRLDDLMASFSDSEVCLFFYFYFFSMSIL